jgi:hypothetical protein
MLPDSDMVQAVFLCIEGLVPEYPMFIHDGSVLREQLFMDLAQRLVVLRQTTPRAETPTHRHCAHSWGEATRWVLVITYGHGDC